MLFIIRPIIIIINFICEHKTDCNTTAYNMVKYYVEQDREAQKCSYLGRKHNRNWCKSKYIHKKHKF